MIERKLTAALASGRVRACACAHRAACARPAHSVQGARSQSSSAWQHQRPAHCAQVKTLKEKLSKQQESHGNITEEKLKCAEQYKRVLEYLSRYGIR